MTREIDRTVTDPHLRSIVLLALAAFGSAATTRITDPILPQLAIEYGVGIATVSMVATGYSLTYGFSQVLFGPVGDRYGKFRIVLGACLCSAVANLLCGAATSLAMLEVFRVISGLAAACIVPLSIAWIGDAIAYDRRQGVLAGFITGQIAGVFAGQAAGGLLGGTFGWRFVFVALAAMFTIVSAGLIWEIVVNPAEPVDPTDRQSFLAGLRGTFGLVARPDMRRLLAAVATEGFAIFGALTFVGAVVKARFGLSLTSVGLMLSAYAVGGLIYALMAARLVQALGQARLACLGAGITALALLAFGLVTDQLSAYLAIVAVGLGFYMMHNTLQTVATQVAPEARGAAVSLFATCFFIAQAFGVFVCGQILERAGAAVLFTSSSCIVVILGAGLYVWLRGWRLA
jgi:MFS transporter, YNFM family, putative membrane transport protein